MKYEEGLVRHFDIGSKKTKKHQVEQQELNKREKIKPCTIHCQKNTHTQKH